MLARNLCCSDKVVATCSRMSDASGERICDLANTAANHTSQPMDVALTSNRARTDTNHLQQAQTHLYALQSTKAR